MIVTLPYSSSYQCTGPKGSTMERKQVTHLVQFEQSLLHHDNFKGNYLLETNP